jgi:hypothetical protein
MLSLLIFPKMTQAIPFIDFQMDIEGLYLSECIVLLDYVKYKK